jgi:hypothetical protein
MLRASPCCCYRAERGGHYFLYKSCTTGTCHIPLLVSPPAHCPSQPHHWFFFFFYKKGGLILIHPPINFPPTLPSQPGVFVVLIFVCLSSCGGPRAVLVVGCGETRLSWELPWTARSHRQAVSWQEVHMQIYTRLPVLPPVCLAPGNTCKLNSVHC